jgi:hypothetical protein
MLLGLTVFVFRAQAGCTGFDAWVPSYQIVGGSSSGTSTIGAPERHALSSGELSLICNLRDQLKNVWQELKEVTTLVAVLTQKRHRLWWRSSTFLARSRVLACH